MNLNGPPLEDLTRRLAQTPSEFLSEPLIGSLGQVHVGALVNDICMRLWQGRPCDQSVLARFICYDRRADRNRLALVMIGAWLLADDWFVVAQINQRAVETFLIDAIAELALMTPAHQFVLDSDRREELARTVLARLDVVPFGETIAQASDRLTAISGTERQRLLNASRAAEERARQIREALASQAARESADKYTRE
jgi:hypothetical protein